jgi:asparagine synthase (glutamine-hydrolysing)
MCAINGVLAFDNSQHDVSEFRRIVSRMNNALAHRGPDGEGVFAESCIALGHRRLAILDPTPAGHQPMVSADDRYVLTFNGEIYNYLELMAELRALGCTFRSRSDSEVIIHAFAVWGERCVTRFNGMWAFAIWDRVTHTLFASRDRFGVKPFVYSKKNGVLYFSSEVRGLKSALALNHANLGKLHDYLAFGYRVNDGETFFAGAYELAPAHSMRVAGGRLKVWRYWALPDSECLPMSSIEQAERLRELLTDAVRIRFRSDVPIALLQSGGLDSSVICSIVNREIEAGRLAGGPITAFTAVHPGHRFDETDLVRELTGGMRHVRSVELVPPGEDLAELLPAYVVALQEPQASSTSFAHWVLMQKIKERGIKVVLNGQGADESFAGYGPLIVGYRLLDLLVSRPVQVLGEARAMQQVMDVSAHELILQTLKAVAGRRAASHWRGWVSEGALRVLSGSFRRHGASRLREVPATFAPSNLRRHLQAQLSYYGFNQILSYEDLSSMSQGIEIRSPFVDYRLMEFAFSLPEEEKFSGGLTKRVIRNAFRADLPQSIVSAGKKIGFATPFDQWGGRESFRRFVSDLTDSVDFRSSSLWDPSALSRRLNDSDAFVTAFPSWRFIVAALWLRTNGIQNA